MKKLVAIFLLLVYTTSALGIAINFHYCGNHLTKLSVLNFGDHKGCDCSSNGTPMGCCKDKLCYHIGDNHNSTQPVIIPSTLLFFIDLPQTPNHHITLPSAYDYKCTIHDYGDWRYNIQPLFILNSVFRI